jgi:hypothetical protein
MVLVTGEPKYEENLIHYKGEHVASYFPCLWLVSFVNLHFTKVEENMKQNTEEKLA